ncbi:hypothetical protein S40288_05155 [Stachybotrys chartarum IBT 40288]|nr:hypothetical protein S40288_05155 [Stachybotrys chartarum IBT 40288]
MPSTPVCDAVFKLNNGYSFPAVGLGTWQGMKLQPHEHPHSSAGICLIYHQGGFGSEDTNALEESIIHALRSGYRLIDTAQYYEIEDVVGRAIRNSGIPRSEITVVTKFWGEWHHNPAEALQISLESMDIEYIDVFLMHWPWATTPSPERKPLRKYESPTFIETWKMMEKLVGPKCRTIGVSNFTQKTLEELLPVATIPPAINQVELHAFNPNLKLVPFCQSKGIVVMSWSTMGGEASGSNLILHHELFKGIGQNHGCSTGVVSLSWAVQRGISVIPKSSSPSRIAENIKLVKLSDEEMDQINNAHKTIKRHKIADHISILWKDVDGVPTLKGWTKVDLGWENEHGEWLT